MMLEPVAVYVSAEAPATGGQTIVYPAPPQVPAPVVPPPPYYPPPPSPPLASNPVWARRPSSDSLVEAYPPEALRLNIRGTVWMRCETTPEGYLRGCRINSERPAGHGFGQALMNLSSEFRVQPSSIPAGADVMVRVEFAPPSWDQP